MYHKYMYTLYDYFRSSASYRVRIVLNYKNLQYNKQEVHLVNNGGEQHSAEYKQINIQGLVPSLLDDQGNVFTQSLAILEYLEEQHPLPNILPEDSIQKSQVRSLAYLIACDMHPLNNLRVLQYLKKSFKISDSDQDSWYHHWLRLGLESYENNIKKFNKLGVNSKPLNYSIGNCFSMADVCLIPQVYNALRFKHDLGSYQNILNIYNNCVQLPCVKDAEP